MPDSDPKQDSAKDPIMARLDDQIDWYGSKGSSNKKAYRWIKLTEIIAAAGIPFMGTFTDSYPHGVVWVTGSLGVLITILEGVLHLNQHQQNWINYRATCEALKHEKYLYLAHAGPYATAADPQPRLAERIESLIAEETGKWSSVQQQQQQEEAGKRGAGPDNLSTSAKVGGA